MLELTDITKELYESQQRLANGSKVLFTLAKEKAESEQIYRRALQVEIVRLRDEKIQATLIPDIARGITADLKYERDLAEAKYITGRDALEAIAVQISALQTILKYEKEI